MRGDRRLVSGHGRTTARSNVPPLPSGRGRKKVRRIVIAGLILVAGVVALIVSGYLLSVELSHARQREEEFHAAVPCPAAVTAADGSATDCVSTASFTVAKVRIHSGKHSYYTADLTGPKSASARRVEFGGKDPLLRRLHSGDTVRGTLWRGDIVTVTSADSEFRQNTADNPNGRGTRVLVVGTILTVVGAGLTVAGGCLTFDRARTAYRQRASRGFLHD